VHADVREREHLRAGQVWREPQVSPGGVQGMVSASDRQAANNAATTKGLSPYSSWGSGAGQGSTGPFGGG